MKISKNNKSIDITPIRICQQCVFLCKNSPACLLSIVQSYIPCGGTYTNEKLSEIFTL